MSLLKLHPKFTGDNNNCQQNSTCILLYGSLKAHTPPSVVLLWIHLEFGEAPTSLLQETLMLYHVMACSPGTSHWKGGTVTLTNLVVITSPFLRLTSLTLERTGHVRINLGALNDSLLCADVGLTLMWHWLSGEKPSSPGVQLRVNLLDFLSTTVTSDTRLGSTVKYQRTPINSLSYYIRSAGRWRKHVSNSPRRSQFYL